MIQPEFTWWPWKTLSIAVPLMALGCALASVENSRSDVEMMRVFFSVLAAANGYLFAMSVGDFGRSVVAIPVGAMAGFVAVHLFSFPVMSVLYLPLLGLIALYYFVFQGRPLVGILLIGATVISFMMMLKDVTTSANPMYAVVCGYPFICGCVAATMPLERNMRGVFEAWLAGTQASMYGMGLGLAVLIASAFLIGTLLSISGALRAYDYLIFGIPAIAFASTANYFCVEVLFSSVYRSGGVPHETAAPVEVE